MFLQRSKQVKIRWCQVRTLWCMFQHIVCILCAVVRGRCREAALLLLRKVPGVLITWRASTCLPTCPCIEHYSQFCPFPGSAPIYRSLTSRKFVRMSFPADACGPEFFLHRRRRVLSLHRLFFYSLIHNGAPRTRFTPSDHKKTKNASLHFYGASEQWSGYVVRATAQAHTARSSQHKFSLCINIHEI